jgi:OsmC-like protein
MSAGTNNEAMSDEFEVVVSAGSLRSADDSAVHFPHRWTPEGVTVEAEFTGAHLLHLAAAGCVLNDLYREAAALAVPLDGARVSAFGRFDTDTWTSTGIGYRVEVDSPATVQELAALVEQVDAVAEIPRAIRSGAPVRRTN